MADTIRSRYHMSQIVNFGNFKIGNTKILPTDIDGFIEYHRRCFIYIEAKYGDNDMSKAQRLALEEVCDDHTRPTILMLVSHEDKNEIDLANANVVKYRINYIKEWYEPLYGPYTANELANLFISQVDNGLWNK